MKALVLREKDADLYYGDWPDPEPGAEEVVVDIRAAALNHRDVYITQGLYPGIRYPVILGSDGAGLVEGREVVLNPSLQWGNDPRVPGKDYHILGLPKDGTFAEKIAVPRSQLFDKPPHLSWEEAAALPLAGLTAFRALFSRGALEAGEKVLIHGVGGGVALLACQFALAAGGEVYVTSSSPEKIEKAKTLGAREGYSYRQEGWAKALFKATGGMDLIVESAGGAGFNDLVSAAAPGARIVTYGGTRGKIPALSPQKIFWKQLSILGSTMGNDAEFGQMLQFVGARKIVPIVDSVFKLSEGGQGFARMDRGLQFGKIVLRIA